MKRLFIGIKIPDEITSGLLPLQTGVRGAKYSPKENFHITLRFIGSLDQNNTINLAEKLSEINHSPFEIGLSSVGFFGNESPHSIHAKVQDSDRLLSLAKKCENVCRNLGHEPDTRKYIPHVTLAYLGKNAPFSSVLEWQARNNLYKSKNWLVEKFYLFSSYTGNGPSHYEIEAEYLFKQ